MLLRLTTERIITEVSLNQIIDRANRNKGINEDKNIRQRYEITAFSKCKVYSDGLK